MAIFFCVLEYETALSQENALRAAAGEPVSLQTPLKSSYDGTVPLAYATLGASIGLAAITGGLTASYFAGTKRDAPSLSPTAGPIAGGAAVGITGRF